MAFSVLVELQTELLEWVIAGGVVIWAIVPGAGAEGQRALVLKPGQPAAVEGQVDSFTAGDQSGLFQLEARQTSPVTSTPIPGG